MPRTKKAFAAVCASALLAGSAAGPAAAATTTQDGLVNVNVGNVNIARDVDVGVAANVAAQVRGVNVGPVQALASPVDATGTGAALRGHHGPSRGPGREAGVPLLHPARRAQPGERLERREHRGALDPT